MTNEKKIIVAPLNWGLGHASRCIPIINQLIKNKFIPVLASDGKALAFLRKEFPQLEFLELSAYNISYKKHLKWSLFLQFFSIVKAVKKEQEILRKYVRDHPNVIGIISDNRFGIYSKGIPSVYITHQVNVLAGIFTPITSFFHQRIIKKFDECWIPDEENSQFSGKLSISSNISNQKYIGVLSRFEKKDVPKTIDILIVLSGPEPNRTQFEEKIIKTFKKVSEKVCLVRGVIEDKQTVCKRNGMTIYNFMLTKELQEALNTAKIVISRPGYSSVMDLVSLQKKALVVPTKNQTEQEYLASYLSQKGYFSFVKEKNFDKKMLGRLEADTYFHLKKDLERDLFSLFEGK